MRRLGYLNYTFYNDVPAAGRAAVMTFLKDCIDKGVRPGEMSLAITARKARASEEDIRAACMELSNQIGANMDKIPEHNKRLREFLTWFRDLCAERALGTPIPEVPK